jgi:hypothetical protein
VTDATADGTDGGDSTAEDPRAAVEGAVKEIRRESLKAAAVPALVDGVVVLLAANLVLALVSARLPGPEWAGLAAAAGLGLVVATGEFALQVRRPPVERFEAANPDLREALRTARDAATAGADSVVARRLYADVLERLRAASSAELVPVRRVAATAVLVVVLSVATVGVAAGGIGLGPVVDGDGGTNGPAANGTTADGNNSYTGLQDGDSVLGAETNVSDGSDETELVISGTEGGAGDDDTPTSNRSYESDRYVPEGSYEAQQAGYDAPDDVQNADIIREYNLRIREDDDE